MGSPSCSHYRIADERQARLSHSHVLRANSAAPSPTVTAIMMPRQGVCVGLLCSAAAGGG